MFLRRRFDGLGGDDAAEGDEVGGEPLLEEWVGQWGEILSGEGVYHAGIEQAERHYVSAIGYYVERL